MSDLLEVSLREAENWSELNKGSSTYVNGPHFKSQDVTVALREFVAELKLSGVTNTDHLFDDSKLVTSVS